MRVLLFDPVVHGHHLEYAGYLIDYLLEQGDEPIFVTWKHLPVLESFLAARPELDLRFVSAEDREVGGNSLRRLFQIHRGLRYTFELALEHGADAVHHLYLDRTELPLTLATSGNRGRLPWRLLGTLWWPYFFHDRDEGVGTAKRLFHHANLTSLGRLLARGRLHRLFVHSARIKRLLLEVYGPTVDTRIVVVPDPSPTPKGLSAAVARQELGLPPDGPVLLFFGALRSDKGPDILLDALRLLDGDWRAVVVGRPSAIGHAEVETYRKTLSHPDRLIPRLGFVQEEDVDRYFAAADVIVLPYRRTFRGTSGVLQHAAAAGKPVIAADVGDIGPTVREQALGLVVEPESSQALARALRTFLRAAQRFQKDVEPRARAYASASDWRVLGEKVRASYSEANSSPRGRL